LYGSNKYWKERYGYHKRSLSETAMYRVKQLLGGRLSLRNYNAQVGETYAMIKALNKLTGLGMPEVVLTKKQAKWVGSISNLITQQSRSMPLSRNPAAALE
ncbi:hypothetical protein AB6C94_01310, partial [Vibrio splendidus]